MLKHMIKIDFVNSILSGVYSLKGIRKSRFDNKGARIASFGGRGMVGACVATFRLNVWDVAVLFSLVSLFFATKGGDAIQLHLQQ